MIGEGIYLQNNVHNPFEIRRVRNLSFSKLNSILVLKSEIKKMNDCGEGSMRVLKIKVWNRIQLIVL